MPSKLLSDIVAQEQIIFLAYTGSLTQDLIGAMTNALEQESEEGRIGQSESINIYTVFIEMSQNIMNYAAALGESNQRKSEGIIVVGITKDNASYYIQSQNAIFKKDKEKIEPRLIEISELDREGLRKLYRERRRSGQNTHEKGGGIGFLEIAKRCESFSYNFSEQDNDKYLFELTALIKRKQKETTL